MPKKYNCAATTTSSRSDTAQFKTPTIPSRHHSLNCRDRKRRRANLTSSRSLSPFLSYLKHDVTGIAGMIALLLLQNAFKFTAASDKLANVMSQVTVIRWSKMAHRENTVVSKLSMTPLHLSPFSKKNYRQRQLFQPSLGRPSANACFVPSINKPITLSLHSQFHHYSHYATYLHSKPRHPTKLFSSSSNWEAISNHQTSKTVKLFKSIHRANKPKRAEAGLTIAEGVRLVTDILSNEESRRLVRRIVVSESLIYGDNGDKYQQELEHWLHVTEEESRQRKAEYASSGAREDSTTSTCSINIGTDQVLAACSGTVSTQGVVALMDIPPPYNPEQSAESAGENNEQSESMPPFYLILDGLSDPGNVGTLLRTCAASHVTALILLPDSCDVWNPKAVRSAMGASFRVPVLEIGSPKDRRTGALDEVLDLLTQCGVDNDRVFAATMEDSGDETNTLRKSLAHFEVDWIQQSSSSHDSAEGKRGGSALILGREGEGLRTAVRHAIKQGKISTVYVPMAPGTESLNAAICGSVVMFERMRQWLVLNNSTYV